MIATVVDAGLGGAARTATGSAPHPRRRRLSSGYALKYLNAGQPPSRQIKNPIIRSSYVHVSVVIGIER